MQHYSSIQQINSIKDVRTFFHHLVYELNIIFHPDDLFEEIAGPNDTFFTPHTMSLYDQLMDRCFSICTEYGEDIYGIGHEILTCKLTEIRNRALK